MVSRKEIPFLPPHLVVLLIQIESNYEDFKKMTLQVEPCVLILYTACAVIIIFLKHPPGKNNNNDKRGINVAL